MTPSTPSEAGDPGRDVAPAARFLALVSSSTAPRFWRAALAVLLGLFFVVQASALPIFERDYDEGVYLAEAQLLRAGHALYTDVPSASPPFFLWGLTAILRVVDGPPVGAARAAVALMGALGLLAMARIGHTLAPAGQRHRAAFLAALLLALFPRWLLYGQMAMADVPSLSLSLVGVALALEAWQRGRRWLVAAGVVTGLAVGTKLLAAYTAPLLALAVLLRYGRARPFRLRAFLLDGGATLGGFVLPLLLALPFVDGAAAYEVIVRFPWEAGRGMIDRANALRLMGIFHAEHLGWSLLALLGLVACARRGAWRPVVLLLGWEALVATMLLQHAPLWGHLLIPLAPPVILAAALALTAVGEAGRSRSRVYAAAVALAALLFVVLWPRALHADRATIAPPGDQALLEQAIVPWVRQHVPPGERVMTDDPMIAVRAGRLVPPTMSDTSFTKLQSGFLSNDDLIATAARDRPAAIIFWSDRFRSKDRWQAWVEANYVLAYEVSPTRRLFLRPDLADRRP